MYCPSCGTANDEQARFCAECGASLGDAPGESGAPPPPPPPPSSDPWPLSGTGPSYPPPPPATLPVPSYLVQSILVTLFCCLPGGIVAIVYSAQAQSKASVGDRDGALRASRLARTWCWVSFGVGLAISLIWLLAVLASDSS